MSNDLAGLREIVVSAVATATALPVAAIGDDANLIDLGLDSLSFAGVLVEVEDAVDIQVPPAVLDRFGEDADVLTVADVVAILADLGASQPATGSAS